MKPTKKTERNSSGDKAEKSTPVYGGIKKTRRYRPSSDALKQIRSYKKRTDIFTRWYPAIKEAVSTHRIMGTNLLLALTYLDLNNGMDFGVFPKAFDGWKRSMDNLDGVAIRVGLDFRHLRTLPSNIQLATRIRGEEA